jgi:hypothetical protein
VKVEEEDVINQDEIMEVEKNEHDMYTNANEVEDHTGNESAAQMDLRYGARNHSIGLYPWKPRSYDHLHAYI